MESNPKYYELLRCLKALVDLKDHKDKNGKDDAYKAEQPKLWRWARNLIKSEKNFFIEENNSVANQGLEIYDSEKRAFDDLNKAQPKEYTALIGKEWKEAVEQIVKATKDSIANENVYNAENYLKDDK